VIHRHQSSLLSVVISIVIVRNDVICKVNMDIALLQYITLVYLWWLK